MSEGLIYQLSIGGTGGFLVGYAAKKIAKIIAVFLGLYAASLLYLNQIGVISVNYEKFMTMASASATNLTDLLVLSIGGLPFAASFIGGFALGIKQG